MKLEFDIRQEGLRAIGAFVDALGPLERPIWQLASVSEHRKRKAEAFRFEKDRRLCLLAGMLLDQLLEAYGLRECDMTYIENEYGKPLFAQHPELHFSLAHSEHMAAAALSTVPVGIDVEYLPAFPRDIADAGTWTEMEAVGKAQGSGIGAFLEGGPYQRPSGFEVEHVSLGDYLACLAKQVQ